MARKKKEEPTVEGAPAWTATFADLATLLLCFFVLLYSMSNIDADKFNQLAESFKGDTLLTNGGGETLVEFLGSGMTDLPATETINEEDIETDEEFKTMDDEIKAMYDDFKTYFAENNLSDKISVEKNDSYLDVILNDNVLFDKGKDEIRSDAIPILESIATLLTVKYPESHIDIIGHTDNDPINVPRFPDNWFLSSARAINVGNYFINQKGFSPNGISAVGRGEFDPIAPNDTEANKSKNRRVELKIKSAFSVKEEMEENNKK